MENEKPAELSMDCGLNGQFEALKNYRHWQNLSPGEKERKTFELFSEVSTQLRSINVRLEEMSTHRDKVRRRDVMLAVIGIAIFLEIGATKLLPILLEAKLFAPLIGG
jgi:hypothetical protein